MSQTIDAYGDPLAFRVREEGRRSPLLSGKGGREVFKVEARQMSGHQKEAVVTEGAHGAAWRVASDEGGRLNGTDLAPFPLGFFNAGLQGDLFRQIRELASIRDVPLEALSMRLENHYWMTGSFALGTGEGHAEPTEIELDVQSAAPSATIEALVEAAAAASPALALLRMPLANTFALYINGRRTKVADIPQSTAPDCADPYRAYSSAPRPLSKDRRADLIEKTGRRETGAIVPAPAGTTTRIVRTVRGEGKMDSAGMTAVDTWHRMPGASHFMFRSDESDAGEAPSGLSLVSAAIAFCYMTQLSRYIEHMKFNIHGVRLVQLTPFEIGPRAGEARGLAHSIDTHLFLNGEASEETHTRLLRIAARTCYLHATSAAVLEPVIKVRHNGTTR